MASDAVLDVGFRNRVSDLVHEVGRAVDQARDTGVETVQDCAEGPTTTMDLWAEKTLVAGLTAIMPGRVVAEERHRSLLVPDEPGSWTWVVDPIDGTSSYAIGLDTWGVQVALCHEGVPVGAWIDCPALGWRLAATADTAALVEGVDAPMGPERVVAGEGDFDEHHRAALTQARIVRRGTRSCAVDYAQLVAGHLDALIFRRTYPWDHVPGAYLVSVFGGRANRWNGLIYEPRAAGEGVVAWRSATDPALVEALLPPV